MIVVMKQSATKAQIANVTARIEQLGCRVHLSEGAERTIIGVIGNGRPLDHEPIERMTGVERTVPILRPFKLASRECHPRDTIVSVNGVKVGGKQVVVMAGPCAVESRDQLLETARTVKGPGPRCCVAGLLNHALLPTVSRAWARRDCGSWPRPARKPGWQSSPR